MSARPKQRPLTETVEGHYKGHKVERTTHPAFGRIELTHRHGQTRLFGSDLVHHETMHCTVYEAEKRRDLNADRIGGQRIICAFECSLAQWAQFIASQGLGAGTPVTLDMYRTDGLTLCPSIDEPQETHLDKFTREMKASIDERMKGIATAITRAQDAVEANAGKVAIREALATAARHASQLPGSVGFVNDQFAESMEGIVSDAKVELEGYVASMAMRTGIEALANAAPSFGQLGRVRDADDASSAA